MISEVICEEFDGVSQKEQVEQAPKKPTALPKETAVSETEFTGSAGASFVQFVGTALIYGGMGVASIYGLLFMAKISPFLAAAGAIGLGYAFLNNSKPKEPKATKPKKKKKLKDLAPN